MDVVQSIESAAHTAVEAVEHPFLTIGARLKALAGHLAIFSGHPYAAPPLQDALATLHGIVGDLAQEVAELRVPCPCKPAPTSAVTEGPSTTDAAGDAGQADAQAPAALKTIDDDARELAEFREWQAAKARAAQFAAS